MGTSFYELMKNKKVSSHPLFREGVLLDAAFRTAAESLSKGDVFSSSSYEKETPNKTLPNIVREAIVETERTLNAFNFPIPPRVEYLKTQNVRYANNDTDDAVISGQIVLKAQFKTITGAVRNFEVPISVVDRTVIPPSVFLYDGTMHVLGQAAINDIIERATSWEKKPLRKQFGPPQNKEEREFAVETREEQGWQPRDNRGKNVNIKQDTWRSDNPSFTASRKQAAGRSTPLGYEEVITLMDAAEEEGLDTFPHGWDYLLRNYVLEIVDVASKDQWILHLINDGYCFNPYGMNRGRRKRGAVEDELEFSAVDPDEELSSRYYNGTKTPIELEDAIRFNGTGGPLRGTVVEVDPEADTLIVKSQGMEYRVLVDDIEPLPRTFRKMYMEGKKN